jgi:hypothetical protein
MGNWFRQMKYKLKSKGIYYTVKESKEEYAWITRVQWSTATTSLDNNSDVEQLTAEFERLGGTWNNEKATKYEEDQNKVLYSWSLPCPRMIRLSSTSRRLLTVLGHTYSPSTTGQASLQQISI